MKFEAPFRRKGKPKYPRGWVVPPLMTELGLSAGDPIETADHQAEEKQ